MSERNVPPDGVGDVRCDDKWRVRLPASYSAYLHSFEPKDERAKLYAACLDGESVLLWAKTEFSRWRNNLQNDFRGDRSRTRQMLAATQFYGGDTEIDRQGRIVLPRNVREALNLETRPEELKVFNDGIIRLVTKEGFEEAKREFAPQSRALDDYAVDQFTSLVEDPAGDGHEDGDG